MHNDKVKKFIDDHFAAWYEKMNDEDHYPLFLVTSDKAGMLTIMAIEGSTVKIVCDTMRAMLKKMDEGETVESKLLTKSLKR